MMIDYKEYWITPSKASELLLNNIANNRKVSATKVMEYSQSILNDQWLVNGETIKISKSGQVIDGQHRLQAIVLANKPVKMGVMTGLPDNVVVTLDSGKVRTAGDVLAIESGVDSKKSHVIASAIKRSIMYEAGRNYASLGGHAKIYTTGTQIKLYLEKNKSDMLDSIDWVWDNLPIRGTLLPTSDIVFFHYQMKKVDRTLTEDFLKKILKGVGLDEGSTEHHLNQLLHKKRSGVSKLSMSVILPSVVKCFNSIRAGRTIKTPGNIIYRATDALPYLK